MRIAITTGPSYEPIDAVRRLSNFSTGELGTLLAEGFAEAGHSVICFRGVASPFAPPLWPVEVVPFTTNENLEAALLQTPARQDVSFVFHAAALCDFRIGALRDESGKSLDRAKISSRGGPLHLTLEPAPKLISSLRRMFPASILVGWKYELDGTAENLAALGRRQMEECLTDACVLNGAAYGSGFGLITRLGEQTHLPDKPALCRFLVDWAERMPVAGSTPRKESFHPLATFMPLSPFI
jgi:phosphopantothenoylcysteine decarboxylase/phosphopantothenate--cysteine ligase